MGLVQIVFNHDRDGWCPWPGLVDKRGCAVLLNVLRQVGGQCRSVASRFIQECFPALGQRCSVCGVLPRSLPNSMAKPLSGMAWACEACRAELQQRTMGFCPRCALVFGIPSEPATQCLQCRLAPPPWENTFFYGPYEGRLKSLVLRFKFQAQLGLGEVLHALLRQSLAYREAPGHDLIVPVPLHPRRLRQRGFNQSLELARGISGGRFGRLEPRAVIRVRDTPPQHTLPRSDRLHNLSGAFLANPDLIQGRSVLLVDDILTTGATVKAASRELLRRGAARVNLLVLARA